MITIQSGKMHIPEKERFIGFAGDNIVSQKQFIISDLSDDTFIYRLYLTFDDGTCNFFLLDKEVGESSTTLTWNVKEEHIFKSGVVKAQIKAISSGGEIFHTSIDYFIVLPSSEYEEYFANKENSEFLRYERFLNTLLDNIEITQQSLPYIGEDGYWYVYDSDKGRYIKTEFTACCDDEKHIIKVDSEMSDTSENPVKNRTVKSYVDSTQTNFVKTSRTIADYPLTDDITTLQLQAKLKVNPDYVGNDDPKESTQYHTGDTYFNAIKSEYYVYNVGNKVGLKWVKINTSGGGTQYTAGDGINITDDTILVDDTVIGGATKGSTSVQLTGDQDIYGDKRFRSANNPSEYCELVTNLSPGLRGGLRFSQSGTSYYVTPFGVSRQGTVISFPIFKESGTYTVATLEDLPKITSQYSQNSGEVYDVTYINALIGNASELKQLENDIQDLIGEQYE